MLSFKQGLSKLSRASGSRQVLRTNVPALANTRRSYADDGRKHADDLFNLFSGGSMPQDSEPDVDSNPFARRERLDKKDVNALKALLSRDKKSAASLASEPLPYQLPRRSVPPTSVEDEGEGKLPLPPTGPPGSEPQAPPPPRSRGSNANNPFAAIRETERSGGGVAIASANYRLYVQAHKTNCILTLINENAELRTTVSSGMCGFKNSGEGTYEAGYQCAVRMFDFVRKERDARKIDMGLEILLSGFGQGRQALLKALTMTEGNGVRDIVKRLTDRTPIKIGGVRAQKRRRL